MDHQSGGDGGAVDCAAAGAGAGLGLLLREQGGRVVGSEWSVAGGEDSHHFAEHPAVTPERRLLFHRFPDRRTTADGIDTAEHDLSHRVTGAVAIGNRLHIQLGVDLPEESGGGVDLRFPQVVVEVALRRDVGRFDDVGIQELNPRHTNGGQLQGYLSTDGPDTNHRHDQ